MHLVVVIRTFQYRQYWESVCAYELYPFLRLLQQLRLVLVVIPDTPIVLWLLFGLQPCSDHDYAFRFLWSGWRSPSGSVSAAIASHVLSPQF